MSRLRSSTPEADASPDALRRFMYPEEYPCYNLAGDYMPTSGCRERCCVLPPGTPEGDDSPKWTHTLAVRQAELESASPLAQPDFNSPKKVFAYDKSSGITPPDVRGKERKPQPRASGSARQQGLGGCAPRHPRQERGHGDRR